MSCVDDALLQMYVEGVLDAADEEILRAHLARCPRCRQHVAAYKELMWDLEHLPEPAVPKELDQLHETLLRAWNEQRRESSRSRRARGLIPAWAGYSVAWARHTMPLDLVGGLLSRAGKQVLASRLPLARRFLKKG